MSVPMNQIDTTRPTEGSADVGLRPPLPRHITSTSSALSSRIGAVTSFLAAGLARIAAPAQVVGSRSHLNHSSGASKTCLATLLSAVATLWVSAALAQVTPPDSGTSAADVIENLARWREDPQTNAQAQTALYYMIPGKSCDSPPSGTDNVDGHQDVTTGVMTPTYGFPAQADPCTVGVGQGRGLSAWNRMIRIKFQNTQEAIALCSDVNGLVWETATESASGLLNARECDTDRFLNFKIPDKVGALEYDLLLQTQGGTQIVLGQWDGDGEWNLESPPACDTVDWQEVELSQATKDVFQCAVDGTAYEYADFHVFTVVEGDSTKICKSQLPINVNNQDNSALFCEQSAGVVRAVFDWDNNSRLPDNSGTRLSWLNTITQFGSRAQGNVACGAAGETVSGRCANQLADGFRAFGDMAGPGGDAIVDLDISNLTGLNAMFVRAGAFNQDIGAWETGAITDMGYMFNTAKSFNQDISGWDTSNMTRMERMFVDAPAFNQNLSDWDVSKVTTMASMFKNAKAFNQDLSGWDVARSYQLVL